MNKKPVNGMRDVLPQEMELRTYVLSVIRDTYRAYGFTEMETPVVESIENLQGKQGGENEKLIFKIMKRGEKLRISEAKEENDLADSGLRYDLTLPLSRYYAAHEAELPKPFKALQIGPVFRAERPQKGRFREFYQCDIDILGENTNLAETELILATTEAVSRLGFRGFVIRLNDRRLLRAMEASTGLSEELYDDLFIALDKMDKIGTEGVREEILKLGMTEESADRLLSLFTASGEGCSVERIRAFQEMLGAYLDPQVADGLVEIIETVESAAEGREEKAFSLAFDPTLVRGMGYYTGSVRKAYVIKEALTTAHVSRTPVYFTANGTRYKATVHDSSAANTAEKVTLDGLRIEGIAVSADAVTLVVSAEPDGWLTSGTAQLLRVRASETLPVADGDLLDPADAAITLNPDGTATLQFAPAGPSQFFQVEVP